MSGLRWRADGWNVRCRIGVLTPAADVGPESEFRAMAPPDVGIHAARVPFAGMGTARELAPALPPSAIRAFAAPPHVDRAAESLAAASVDAIAFAFTSSAYALGAEAEAEMLDRLRAHGRPVVATCAAAVLAVRALGASRVAVIHPPWFDAELDRLGRAYYERSGFDVVHCAACGLPRGQRLIDPAALYGWALRHVPDAAESVVIAGNGFRAVGVIDALEAALARPVLTANQVLLWAALRAAGAPTAGITRYGRLFCEI